MIAIIDYGVGNLFSLVSSLKYIGIDAVITSNEDEIAAADRIILPGVGAFGDAIKALKQSGLDKVVCAQAKSGKPLMGICLGMQLLFDKSYEYGEYEGLHLISGEVIPMKENIQDGLKIPHIGWNALKLKRKNPLFKYINDGDFVYFVHSFFVNGENPNVDAATDYGALVAATVSSDNIYGCQFHPEKSGEIGLAILRAFNEI